MATDPIICPACRQPAALPQQMQCYKSYNIVPFHFGACGSDWSVSTLTTLALRSDWLQNQQSETDTLLKRPAVTTTS